MAGYIGSKSSVTQVDGYNQAEADAEFVNDPNSVITVSGSNVGIGNSNPSAFNSLGASDKLVIGDSTDSNLTLFGTTYGSLAFADSDASSSTAQYAGLIQYYHADNSMQFYTGSTERMRIDSSGNLLVGKTTTAFGTAGHRISGDGYFYGTRAMGANGTDPVFIANILNNDGNAIEIYKNSSKVGSIAVTGTEDLTLYSTATGHKGLRLGQGYYIPTRNDGAPEDNTVDIGLTAYRYNDIYASNGTIQTSDRNEKQDIEVLSDAETRVAQACKGLLRKFRWQDAVAKKGDDARIHFGIIAQDLQDAFAAEGLDAGRYAMFISSTWWETQTEVPAVEAVAAVYEDVVIPAVLDEDGNEVEAERTEQQLVTEAVEAKEAYTRTDTYETLEEAPEGATERTRLGVRYPELLAFIIGAM